MARTTKDDSITEARIMRALAISAEVVLVHGDAYAPILERLENELRARQRDTPVQRAAAILAASKGHRYLTMAGSNL